MAQNTFGCTFQLSATAITGTSTGKLSEVTNVNLPDPSRDAEETTHHDSVGGVAEMQPSAIVNVGQIEVEMNWVAGSATDIQCEAAVYSATVQYFKARAPIPGGATFREYTGSGVVTGYKRPPLGVKGVPKATITVQPSGAVTRTTV
ncbi:MAG: hypothetical protein ACJ8DZ_06360 [Allosphingosinicella sp.]